MDRATNRTAELIAALRRMLDLLDRERKAVAAFQLDQVAAIAEDKKRTLDDFTGLAHAARGENVPQAMKLEAQQLYMRVQTQSHANMLLLHSVRQALSASMGLADEGNTYNARARRTSAYSQRAGRAY